jgi:hypothetical protein
MALIWSMACLLPFSSASTALGSSVTTSPGRSHCASSCLILDRVIVGRTAIGIAAALAHDGPLLTATLSPCSALQFRRSSLTRPIVAVAGDPGTKAAAWWIRQNTAPGRGPRCRRVCGTSASVSLCYFHRPVASVELDGHSTVSGMFEQVGSAVDVLVIGAERVPSARHAASRAAASSAPKVGKVRCTMLRGSAETGAEPQRLEAGELNRRYDAHYATLSEITALPLREIQAHQRSAPP